MMIRTVQIVTVREVDVYVDTDEEAIAVVQEMYENGDACASDGDAIFKVTNVFEEIEDEDEDGE